MKQKNMKALILCAGQGTRLMPLTRTTPKQLLPVANKPILFYLLEQIQRAGIRDVGVVVSPEVGDSIRQAVGDGATWGVSFTYIQQPQPLGLAHAVRLSREFLGDDDFLMLLGDNLAQDDAIKLVKRFYDEQAVALVSLKEVADCRQFGVAQIDDDGRVTHLVEKPKQDISHLAVAGLYVFSPHIHPAIDAIVPSSRGELEITDAIQQLIADGYKVTSHNLSGWWFDIGTPQGLLQANRKMLDTCLERNIACDVGYDNHIEGQVVIQAGTTVAGSTIRGPVSIGRNCRIQVSIIGPCVSIGDGVSITGSTIEDSVILDGGCICNARVLCRSLISRRAEITAGTSWDAGVIELCAGDDEHIRL